MINLKLQYALGFLIPNQKIKLLKKFSNYSQINKTPIDYI